MNVRLASALPDRSAVDPRPVVIQPA
jgi:hypothetical protein